MRNRLSADLLRVAGGALTLAAVIGTSRFFFTAILPRMQDEHAFTAGVAGLLATSNLAGYLVGVLIPNSANSRTIIGWNFLFPLVINILAVAAMGLTGSLPEWIALRFVSGLCSGVTFVALALIVSSRSLVIMYAGVGIGIACSGALSTLPLDASHSWLWASSGMAAIVAVALFLLRRDAGRVNDGALDAIRAPVAGKAQSLAGISVAYLLEGFGYIIGTTFLVADFTTRFGFTLSSVGWVWAVVGLAAATSCFTWSFALRWYSSTTLLRVAYSLQLFGCLLPLLSGRRAAAWVAAAIIGATFMGITSLSLYHVRFELLQPDAVARISAFYAVGQMLGPAVAGGLAEFSASRNSIWILAVVPIALAALITSTNSRTAQCRT